MASFTEYYRIDNNFNNFPYKKYSISYFKKKKNPDPNLLLLTSWCVTSVCATSVTCSHTENASDLFLLTRYTNYNFKNNLNLLFKRILIYFLKLYSKVFGIKVCRTVKSLSTLYRYMFTYLSAATSARRPQRAARAPERAPTVAGTTPCGRYCPERTRSCGFPENIVVNYLLLA